MLSIPPATMMSLVPAAIWSCASIAAFIAEPHILLTVVQPVASGKPALNAACPRQFEVDGVRDCTLLDLLRKCARLAHRRVEIHAGQHGDGGDIAGRAVAHLVDETDHAIANFERARTHGNDIAGIELALIG